jgi:hypothetical protein
MEVQSAMSGVTTTGFAAESLFRKSLARYQRDPQRPCALRPEPTPRHRDTKSSRLSGESDECAVHRESQRPSTDGGALAIEELE